MRKLTDIEKDDLKALTQHRGFKVLESLVEDKNLDLLSQFKKANLWDPQVAMNLSNTQNFLAWMEELITIAKNKSKKAIEKKL